MALECIKYKINVLIWSDPEQPQDDSLSEALFKIAYSAVLMVVLRISNIGVHTAKRVQMVRRMEETIWSMSKRANIPIK